MVLSVLVSLCFSFLVSKRLSVFFLRPEISAPSGTFAINKTLHGTARIAQSPLATMPQNSGSIDSSGKQWRTEGVWGVQTPPEIPKISVESSIA
jgi:hypothetical protein